MKYYVIASDMYFMLKYFNVSLFNNEMVYQMECHEGYHIFLEERNIIFQNRKPDQNFDKGMVYNMTSNATYRMIY